MYPAILVQNAVYCHPRSNHRVLNGLCMKVQAGTIYGLTGSSGCGKTTLISCILGEHKLKSGQLYLNGYSSAEQGIEVVRNQVAYMPQEVGLFSRFTVLEMLSLFGQLAGISQEVLKFRREEQLQLMKLQHKKHVLLCNLSGGECRRVSLSATLISSKEILILDEPTVGMDPLIQIRIWKHLRGLVAQKQYTVFITTHYFEEMKIADKIGYMADGRLQVEASPAALLTVTNSTSIGDAVLKIQKTSQLREPLQMELWKVFPLSNDNHISLKQPVEQVEYKHSKITTRVRVLGTLLKKNFKQQRRNLTVLLCVILLPALHLISILPMGSEPKGFQLGVVNMELDNSTTIKTCLPATYLTENSTCHLEQLGCTFLNLLDTEKIMLTFHTSKEMALTATRNGHSYGYLYFSETFSASLIDRVLSGDRDVTSFIHSQIVTRLDQSNAIVRVFLVKELYKAQGLFLSLIMRNCLGSKTDAYSLQYLEPVYGTKEDYSFFNYCAVGYAPITLFVYSMIPSALRFVEERDCGMLKRLLVSGISFVDIVIAHYLSEAVLAAIQSSLLLGLIYGLAPIGRNHIFPVMFVFVLINVIGWVGLSAGLLLGLVVKEKLEVALVGVCILVPSMLMSGVIWPMEGMSSWIKMFAEILPFTLPIESIRWIWSRGSRVLGYFVWSNFVLLFSYILLINVVIMAVFKLKM